MRQFLTPSSIAAAIRMLRSTFTGSFLLVEGDVDARLYGRLVDRTACHVQICNNRANVVCVVKILDRGGFVGHLGIIDKDFAPLIDETHYASENLLGTDENDIELTILCSDTLERFLSEYGNPTKIMAVENDRKEKLRDVLIRSASLIGTLLLLSRVKGWNLDFDGMTIRFTERTLDIDLDRQIEHLRGRSQGTTMPDLAQVKAEMSELANRQSRVISHTRGCDLCEVLSKGVHDVFGRNHHKLARGGVAVEEIVRAGYSRENFAQTRLFAAIKGWEAKRAPLRIM
jgi:hypothetical protein